MENRTSIGVIYFGVGLTLGTMSTMIVLTLLRPFLPLVTFPSLRYIALFSPLVIGIALGLRIRHVGLRDNLRMAAALKRSLGFGGHKKP